MPSPGDPGATELSKTTCDTRKRLALTLLVLAAVTCPPEALAAGSLVTPATGAVPWWVWPQALFVVCFFLGIVAVPSVIGMMLGARLGAKLLGVLSATVVRRLVLVLLVFAGVRALLKGLGIWN